MGSNGSGKGKSQGGPGSDAFALALVLAALWIFFHFASGGLFLKPVNLSNLMSQTAVTGILAAGMLLVIVSGNIDLSVGSVLGLAGGVAALVVGAADGGLGAAVAASLLTATAVGLLNGNLVAHLGIPSFIATLGGLLAWRGVLKWITNAGTVSVSDEAFLAFGQQYIDPRIGWSIAAAGSLLLLIAAAAGWRGPRTEERLPRTLRMLINAAALLGFVYVMNSHAGIPVPAVALAVSAAAAHIVSRHTVFGRHLFAVGANPQAARLSGVAVARTTVAVFVLMGLFTALASVVYTARLGSALPEAGVLKELDAVAACVIGGASLSGGKGTVGGALLGALVMASLDNGMGLMGVSAFKQEIVRGVILVAAVGADGIRSTRGRNA